MKVKNLEGTGSNVCTCGSWLEHWKKYSGQALPVTCPTLNCKGNPEVGAHVKRVEDVKLELLYPSAYSSMNSHYIIPLCSNCNNRFEEELEVMDTIKLVSANQSETCAKE